MPKRFISLLVILMCSMSAATAQMKVIDAGNIARLRSAAQINFDDLRYDIDNGWFAMDENGGRFAVMSRNQEVVILDDRGQVLDSYVIEGADALPNPIHDIAFTAGQDQVVSVHVEGGAYYVVYRWFLSHFMDYYQFRTADLPINLWVNAHVWLEVTPFDVANPYVVMQLNPRIMNRARLNEMLGNSEVTIQPSSPNNDPESVIRIGRIEPPLAVTITEDGRVKRWNMETGKITAEVQIDPANGLPLYGALNAGGDSHLAWRDPASTSLNLLNFETVENRMIVPLDGSYIPFIFLSRQADVIIGVHVDDVPSVVAWDVATGQRYDLEAYRACNRPPDMVRLSRDGALLVIGCDTGLDIWRID